MIKLKYTEFSKALDLWEIEEEIKRLNDLKKEIENENIMIFEYIVISSYLKRGYHIRAFYDKLRRITCFIIKEKGGESI